MRGILWGIILTAAMAVNASLVQANQPTPEPTNSSNAVTDTAGTAIEAV